VVFVLAAVAWTPAQQLADLMVAAKPVGEIPAFVGPGGPMTRR